MKQHFVDIGKAVKDKSTTFRPYLLSGVGLLVILLMVGSAEKQFNARSINRVDIRIKTPYDHQFIKEKDVKYMIRDQYNAPLESKKQAKLELAAMEKRFEENPFIRKAEVFNDLDGTLVIQISQRNPILRVINQKGKSFYLDDMGQKMPTSYQYTAPVLTAKGHIRSSADQLDTVKKETVQSLYSISRHVRKDSLLNALIGSIDVSKDQEFSITPRVGDQVIILGEAKNLEKRFRKLKVFYRKVLPQKGWHQYDTINLKFKKQIVAKK